MSQTEKDSMDNTMPIVGFSVIIAALILMLVIGSCVKDTGRGPAELLADAIPPVVGAARVLWALSIPALLIMILRRLPPKN